VAGVEAELLRRLAIAFLVGDPAIPVGGPSQALLERGWHPRHIAGLIRSKFERDHGWGDAWKDYSPALRADYYTRIFAGRRASVVTEAEEIRKTSPATKQTPATAEIGL
jgi:hypothetical protein